MPSLLPRILRSPTFHQRLCIRTASTLPTKPIPRLLPPHQAVRLLRRNFHNRTRTCSALSPRITSHVIRRNIYDKYYDSAGRRRKNKNSGDDDGEQYPMNWLGIAIPILLLTPLVYFTKDSTEEI